MRTDPYVETGARPEPGTLWVWEPRSDHAAALIEVVRCWWNGEEWVVRTKVIASTDSRFTRPPTGTEHVNDLSRFWEACHRVAKKPGLVGTPEGIRRGPRQLDEGPPD